MRSRAMTAESNDVSSLEPLSSRRPKCTWVCSCRSPWSISPTRSAPISLYGNAWLRTEAKRSELAAGGIRVRLRECEQFKSDHPDWVACCCKG